MFDFNLDDLSILDGIDLGEVTSSEPERKQDAKIFPTLINMDFKLFEGHKLALPVYMYLCSETVFITMDDAIENPLLRDYNLYKAPKGLYKRLSEELLSMDDRKTKTGEQAHPKADHIKEALAYLEGQGLIFIEFNSHPDGRPKTTVKNIYIKKLKSKEEKKEIAMRKGASDNKRVQGDKGVMLDNRILKALTRTFRTDSLKVYLYIFSKKAWVQKNNKKDSNFYVNASNILEDVYNIPKEEQTKYQLMKIYTVLSDLKTLGFIKVDTEVQRDKIKNKDDILFYSYFKIWGVKYLTYNN